MSCLQAEMEKIGFITHIFQLPASKQMEIDDNCENQKVKQTISYIFREDFNHENNSEPSFSITMISSLFEGYLFNTFTCFRR